MRLLRIALLLIPAVGLAAAASRAPVAGSRIDVAPNESARRVDIMVDGKPFTSYIWPTTLKKPTLFPLRTAKGTLVTRGYPLEPREGERVDHPHHVGLWLNHGDVNGLDFWNNSDAIPADRAPKMGTILHRRIVEAKSGADHGELAVEMDWVGPDQKPLLHEQTRFVFRGSGDSRTIDRLTRLTADQRVVFNDIKEGFFGMRVARALEQPDDKPAVLTDASGKPMAKPIVDKTGVTGEYLSSEGLKGDAVWGTRGRWTLLSGTVGSEPVTIAILDNPSNPGFPTYWHARGYGLFAANPLGVKDFTNGKEQLNLAIDPGKSVTFKYRVLILSGPAKSDRIEQEYQAFAKQGS